MVPMKAISFEILSKLVDCNNAGLSWKDFAESFQVSSATLAKYLQTLQKEDLIRKKLVSLNPISTKYFITEKGRKTFVNEGKNILKRMQKTRKLISRASIIKT